MNEWLWMLPPLLAGLMVVITHVRFGQEVLKRGIVFIDLTIAQIAALGVIIATVLGWQAGWLVQLSAMSAALLAAALLQWTERFWPERQEALIGSLYVLAASVIILLLNNNPQAGEHIDRILAGQILWLGWADIWAPGLIYAGVLAVYHFGGERGFYPLFAILVTCSVQMVGLYLVFAGLVMPALAADGQRNGWLRGSMIGCLGYIVGFGLSVSLDLPTGPTVVATLAFSGIAYRITSQARQPSQ